MADSYVHGLRKSVPVTLDANGASIHGDINAAAAVTLAALTGGQHVSVTPPGMPRPLIIDPDVDIWVKSGTDDVVQGLRFNAGATDGTDAYYSDAVDWSSTLPEWFNFGTGGMSIEIWFQQDSYLSGTGAGDNTLVILGANGANQIRVWLEDSSGTLQAGLDWQPASGTQINTGDVSLGVATDTALHHLCIVCERGSAGGTGYVRFYLDGVEVAQDTWTEDSPLADMALATINSREWFCCTNTSTHTYDGLLFELRVYQDELTAAQVAARTGLGPCVGVDAYTAVTDDGILPVWVVDYNQTDYTWADPDIPESVSWGHADSGVAGSILQASDNVTGFAGGVAAQLEDYTTSGLASTATSPKVYAHQPKIVHCAAATLSIFSEADSAGAVRIS